CDLVRMESCVQWNGRTTCGKRAEVSHHPTRMVIRQDGDTGAEWDAGFSQPMSHAFGVLPDLHVGIAFKFVAFLDFERGMIGPALRAFAKTIVKAWHC